jgi:arylsulfatase A-like enzyme
MRQDGMQYLPRLRQLTEERGLRLTESFVTTSLCCPLAPRCSPIAAPATNHGGKDNNGPSGGMAAFRPHEDEALPVWLCRAGYHTAWFGKYLNGHVEERVPRAGPLVPVADRTPSHAAFDSQIGHISYDEIPAEAEVVTSYRPTSSPPPGRNRSSSSPRTSRRTGGRSRPEETSAR